MACRGASGSRCARRAARCASSIPLALDRLGIRNHRKLLVCDERVAFFGGFNIASEYDGDGVTRGWCDLGLKVGGPLPVQLAATFEEMFARADFQHKRFVRLRKIHRQKAGADAGRATVAQRAGARDAARSSAPCAGIWTRANRRADHGGVLSAYLADPAAT